MKDSLSIAKQVSENVNSNVDSIISIIDTLKWPILLLIIFLFLIKPIKNLINRMTKVGHGGTTLEANQQVATINQEIREVTNVERALGLFRTETIEGFKEAVEKEADIEKLTTQEQKIEQLTKYSITLYIIKHFEQLYFSIYGSQLHILQHLNTFPDETKDSLKRFYDYAVEKYPNFYENYSYDEYINFLFNLSLITEKNGTVGITIMGVDFLKYLTEVGRNFNKRY